MTASRAGVRRVAELAAHPLGAAALALTIALILYLLGPPGNDQATHLYQTEMFERDGWRFWHNLWYGGHYSQINYSLTYYPLAAFFGTGAVVGAGAAGAAGAFALMVRRRWPDIATVPILVFAATVPLSVIAGTYPFVLAMAPGLFALVAAQHRRPVIATALTALTAATHPLAFGFLVVALIGVALVTPGWWRIGTWRLLTVGIAVVVAIQAILTRAFTAPGVHYPFDEKDAMAIAAYCVAGALLTRGLAEQRMLRMFFIGYGVVSLGALLITSPVGGNVVRLMLLMGGPLLLLPLAARGYRPVWLAAPLAAGAVFWQVLPAITGWDSIAGAGAPNESFWQPVDRFLAENGDSDHRVEVVATVDNWEGYFIARRGVALARGWYRQYDWPPNAALYEPLDAAAYERWLRGMGVRYVLLPDDPLDGSTGYELAVLKGNSGLARVKQDGAWTIYELPNATPIATPADGIHITRMGADTIDFDVARAGVYDIRVRYTPYWRVTKGEACVDERGSFGMALHVSQAGPVRLAFKPDVGTALRTAVGRGGQACP